MTFYVSTGDYQLDSPPSKLESENAGEIYMHKSIAENLSASTIYQLWLKTTEGWMSVQEGHRHPSGVDSSSASEKEKSEDLYVLAINLSEEPAWVKLSTYGRYVQKRHQK